MGNDGRLVVARFDVLSEAFLRLLHVDHVLRGALSGAEVRLIHFEKPDVKSDLKHDPIRSYQFVFPGVTKSLLDVDTNMSTAILAKSLLAFSFDCVPHTVCK